MLHLLLLMESAFPALFILVVFGIAIVSLVVWIVAIIEIAQSDFKGENDKIVWLLIVILVGIIGALIYYAVGRKQRL